MEKQARHELAGELEQLQEAFLELVAEAKQIVEGSPVERHSLAYWIAHIESACGGSLDSRWEQTIQTEIDDLTNDEDWPEDEPDIDISTEIALENATDYRER